MTSDAAREAASAVVLANRGVPVELLVLDADGVPVEPEERQPVRIRFSAWVVAQIERRWAKVEVEEHPPMLDEDGEPQRFVDLSPVPDLSKPTETVVYKGQMAWAKSMMLPDSRSMTLLETVALALGWDPDGLASQEWTPRRVGAAMVDGADEMYRSAVEAAWSMANGVDPTQAWKLFQASMQVETRKKAAQVEAGQRIVDEVDAEIEKLTTGAARGGTGGTGGLDSAVLPPSSGS